MIVPGAPARSRRTRQHSLDDRVNGIVGPAAVYCSEGKAAWACRIELKGIGQYQRGEALCVSFGVDA
ncbi:MAG TPA: hypothetical protein VF748_00125 [Candidatus Acidoferrum sp.]